MPFSTWAEKKAKKSYIRTRYNRLAYDYLDATFYKHEGLNLDILSEFPSMEDFELVLQVDQRTGNVSLPAFYTIDLVRPAKWKQALIRAMVRIQLSRLHSEFGCSSYY